MARWIALEEVEVGRCQAICKADAEAIFSVQYPGRRIRAVSVLSHEQQMRDESALDRNKKNGYRDSQDDEDEEVDQGEGAE